LASQNDFAGASEQFQLALQVQPNDADAEANLGSALAEMGRFSQAKTHFERALQINPNHALAKENLQELQRATNK
jgi:Flp pilus assembly protein TadD